jgi:hypothetical protein
MFINTAKPVQREASNAEGRPTFQQLLGRPYLAPDLPLRRTFHRLSVY